MLCSTKILACVIFCLCFHTVYGAVDTYALNDCKDVYRFFSQDTGVYIVYPNDYKDRLDVYCDQETDGGGWLVIQRRQDGSEDFYRDWESYLHGFGNLSGEFWLGNENIHRLTYQKDYQLRIDMEDFDNDKRYALYNYFSVGPVTDYYRLFVLGYSGDAGDSFSEHHGYEFSANNVDRDTYYRSCAEKYKGAWWYSRCHSSNLNGQYLKGEHSSYADGVNWEAFRGYHYSLKKTEMKIRPMPVVLTE